MRGFLVLLLAGSAVPFLSWALLQEAHGQDAEKKDTVKKEDDVQREKMLRAIKSLAASYTVSIGDNKKSRLKLADDPLMRFSNPLGVSKDGAVFVWTESGRPHALLKVFSTDGKTFSQEWQSLSEALLVVERNGEPVWTPANAGIEFREFPDAPKPAETAPERLRQMKKLAGQFKASYAVNEELRLLAQPLHRFESKASPSCVDGLLVGFVQSTTPMLIIQLEARGAGESNRWHYAVARLSTGPIAVKLGDNEVFSVSRYVYDRDPKKPFLQLTRIAIPME